MMTMMELTMATTIAHTPRMHLPGQHGSLIHQTTSMVMVAVTATKTPMTMPMVSKT